MREDPIPYIVHRTPVDWDDPQPDTAVPLEVFRAIAAKHGLIRPGDPLDQKVVDAFADLVDRCATIGDAYGGGEAGGNAGEHIRALYSLH